MRLPRTLHIAVAMGLVALHVGTLCVLTACQQRSEERQTFRLERSSDTLSVLHLETIDHQGRVVRTDQWDLPYPVYRFCQGDVNADGADEALVGVEKTTRFDPTVARRLFVFKNLKGHIRPLWLGSHLGGKLVDFTLVDGHIRTVEMSADSTRYSVVEYSWGQFSPSFERYIIQNTTKHESLEFFAAAQSGRTDSL